MFWRLIFITFQSCVDNLKFINFTMPKKLSLSNDAQKFHSCSASMTSKRIILDLRMVSNLYGRILRHLKSASPFFHEISTVRYKNNQKLYILENFRQYEVPYTAVFYNYVRHASFPPLSFRNHSINILEMNSQIQMKRQLHVRTEKFL